MWPEIPLDEKGQTKTTSERQRRKAVEIRDAVIALAKNYPNVLANLFERNREPRLLISWWPTSMLPATEIKNQKDGNGKSANLPYRIKIEDVSDVTNPVEVFNVEWDDADTLNIVFYTSHGNWESELQR